MIKVLFEPLKQFLSLGVKASNPTEVNRQISVINLFAAVGFSITFILAIGATVNADYPLALSLFGACIIFYLSHRLVTVTKKFKGHRVASNILLYSLMLLMLYLVYSGGNNNTGPLWIYLVPPVALFFGGLKKGMRDITVFLTCIILLLFMPVDAFLATEYSFEFKTRIIYSFLTLTFLSAFYEYSRQQSYMRIQDLSDRFERQARRDSLTKLPNRRSMREQLEYEQNRSNRSKQSMSVLICDIDHFKQINDQFGHSGGDYVLIQISDIFRKTLRKQDIVARWGGEEFLFLLPETNAYEAFILAEKIRTKVKQSEFFHDNAVITTSVSIGIAEVTPETSIDKAISLADHFLYKAKEKGRDCTLPKLTG